MAHSRLLQAVARFSQLTGQHKLADADILPQASAIIKELVAVDDWLPPAMAEPHPRYYSQHLLYGDPLDRFSLVSFVWGPGQQTPIHDHTVWGVIGMLRGAEIEQAYRYQGKQLIPCGPATRLEPGDVGLVSPDTGDIHRVSNAYEDRVSISIHVYGGNIGKIIRSTYQEHSGQTKPFISGYSNTVVPNLWGPTSIHDV